MSVITVKVERLRPDQSAILRRWGRPGGRLGAWAGVAGCLWFALLNPALRIGYIERGLASLVLCLPCGMLGRALGLGFACAYGALWWYVRRKI